MMKKFILLTLGTLALLSQMVCAELKPHSDEKSTYIDIINNTDYYVWLTDVQQFNLPGKGASREIMVVTREWSWSEFAFKNVPKPTSVMMRESRTFSVDKAVAPGDKETLSWNEWGSGITFLGNPITGAKLKFGSQNTQPETGAEYAFNLTPHGMDQDFDVTIGGKKVNMRLQVTCQGKEMRVSDRLYEPYCDYTITISSK